jgi:hypothetical protein
MRVFLGCGILIDGPHILKNRMWFFDQCTFLLFEGHIFYSHPGQHSGQHLSVSRPKGILVVLTS